MIKSCWQYAKQKYETSPNYIRNRFINSLFCKLYYFWSALRFELYYKKRGISNPNQFTTYYMKSCFGHDGVRGREMFRETRMLNIILIK
jgi:hypothetical protein